MRKVNLNFVKPLMGTGAAMRLYLIAAPLLLTVGTVLLSQFGYRLSQVFLTLLLFDICLYPTARYFSRRESGLPTMAIFCAAYALQFAMPIFTQNPTIDLALEIKYLEDKDVTAALVLAIAGIVSLLVGYYSFKKSRFQKLLPAAGLHLNKAKAILYCILVTLLLPVLFNLRDIIPQEFQLPLGATQRLLQTQVLVAIGVLGWIVYGLRDSKLYLIALHALVIAAAVRGIATGALEEAVMPFAVFFLVKWFYTRRLPVAMILIASALVLFLSPVKREYREQIWYGEPEVVAQMSLTSKALLWVQQSAEYWSDTFAGNSTLAEATSSTTSRADFIHQVAHIHSMTPSVVPYQYGQTYSYFAVALIPRAIWQGKPMAGNANTFYAVNYGITTEEGAKLSTFGVSILGEAYINFGWYGVVLMMLLQGLFISVIERIFGSAESGPGGQAVFIAFFVFFLNGIGSSAEMLFGNILQNLLFGYLLLLWARRGTFVRRRWHARPEVELRLSE